MTQAVLIAAFRGKEHEADNAFRFLDDPEREFVSSIFVKLEVLPKAAYYRQIKEEAFYEAFFGSVAQWTPITEQLLNAALEEAQKCGLGALDALHLVAAAHSGADELITAEKMNRPIYRTSLCKVISIHE